MPGLLTQGGFLRHGGEAKRLVTWLNAGAEREARERIIEVIEGLQGLSAMWEECRSRYGGFPGGLDPRRQALELEMEELNKDLLSRYVGTLKVWAPGMKRGSIRFVMEQHDAGPAGKEEFDYFSDVMGLAREGNLGRLVRCEVCGRWLFSKSPSGKRVQRQHPGACKRKWKRERMREYMKRKRKDPNFDGAGFFSE